MQDFILYFQLGWSHIMSWESTDHLLFIMALTCMYSIKQWKNVLILITAFTVGHSLTLFLSVCDWVRFKSDIVEFLIPITILITGISNIVVSNKEDRKINFNYLPPLFFGLIHGMGFANAIRFMIAKADSIGLPLVSFNIGIEAGQLIVVFLILIIFAFLHRTFGVKQKWWNIALSSLACLLAIYMCIQRWPF
jgi:hypothetical protein